MAGPVITQPEHPQYKGATKKTNNAGELIAITEMCKAASAVATPQDEVEIQTDSVLASPPSSYRSHPKKHETQEDKPKRITHT